MALRLGGHAIAAGDLADLDATAIDGVLGNQLVEKFLDDAAGLAVAQPCRAFRLCVGRAGIGRGGFFACCVGNGFRRVAVSLR